MITAPPSVQDPSVAVSVEHTKGLPETMSPPVVTGLVALAWTVKDLVTLVAAP